jgi:hypothetical protein
VHARTRAHSHLWVASGRSLKYRRVLEEDDPMIDMDIIRALAFQGVPDMEGLRSIYWKVRSHCAQCTRAHMSARHASRRRDVRAWAWGSCVSHTHNACVRAAAPGLFAARQARVVPSPAAEQVHARTLTDTSRTQSYDGSCTTTNSGERLSILTPNRLRAETCTTRGRRSSFWTRPSLANKPSRTIMYVTLVHLIGSASHRSLFLSGFASTAAEHGEHKQLEPFL